LCGSGRNVKLQSLRMGFQSYGRSHYRKYFGGT
jgi:hypothetical protein